MGDGEARPLRFITAAALFDGHDSAINLVRRLLVDQGAQVVHLGQITAALYELGGQYRRAM